jgi:sorbitol/mannitol transport system permease protein
MTVEAEARPGRHATVPPGSEGTMMRRTGDWARRAPLLPALVFMILVTQLPFVVTVIVSFMNWNAYYPDERGSAASSPM